MVPVVEVGWLVSPSPLSTPVFLALLYSALFVFIFLFLTYASPDVATPLYKLMCDLYVPSPVRQTKANHYLILNNIYMYVPLQLHSRQHLWISVLRQFLHHLYGMLQKAVVDKKMLKVTLMQYINCQLFKFFI